MVHVKLSIQARRNIKARLLLGEVDDQLRRFGPRRALQKLALLKYEAPYGTHRWFNEYEKVLAGINERQQSRYQDQEACQSPAGKERP